MTFKKLATVGICLSFFVLLCKAQGNNKQIAYNKSTKESAMEIIVKNNNITAFEELYDDWDNVNCHSKTEIIPNTYKIDLRNFSMPIEQSFITSNFGKRWNRNHNGVDIKACHGDTIYSAFGGKVRVVKNDTKGMEK